MANAKNLLNAELINIILAANRCIRLPGAIKSRWTVVCEDAKKITYRVVRVSYHARVSEQPIM
jgi:arsenate reductase-like glutaredoxin family protein